MSVAEIKSAIVELPPAELADLLSWIEELQADEWDEQIARDAREGKFDALLEHVRRDIRAGDYTAALPGDDDAPAWESRPARTGGQAWRQYH